MPKREFRNKPSSEARSKLRTLRVKPDKGFGQNFIIEPSVITSILEFAAPRSDERLVEIGPGLGALTQGLLQYGAVTAVEIEKAFCEKLTQTYPSLKVIQADASTFDFSSLGSSLTVFGNLPYAFSTAITFNLIKHASNIKRAVLLLQKEFAERLAASPGGRDYGILTVARELWADAELGPVFKGTVFHPPARVESRLIQLSFLGKSRFEIKDQAWFQKVVKACFLQRRKKILNSLVGSNIAPREQIEHALSQSSIDPSARAETVGLEGFVRLAQTLSKS